MRPECLIYIVYTPKQNNEHPQLFLRGPPLVLCTLNFMKSPNFNKYQLWFHKVACCCYSLGGLEGYIQNKLS